MKVTQQIKILHNGAFKPVKKIYTGSAWATPRAIFHNGEWIYRPQSGAVLKLMQHLLKNDVPAFVIKIIIGQAPNRPVRAPPRKQ